MKAVMEATAERTNRGGPAPSPTVSTRPTATWGVTRVMFLGFALALVYPLLPSNGVLARALIGVVELGAFGALVARVRSGRLTHRRSWTLISMAVGFWVAGDSVFTFYDLVRHRIPSTPGASDPFFILAYACAAWGLYRLTRERTGLRSEVGIDTALVCLGVAIPMFILWIEPSVIEQPGPLFTKVVLLLYTFGDFLFVSLLGRMLFTRRGASRSVVILASGVSVLFVSDIVQTAAFSTGHLDWLRFVQVGWLCSAILISASAWHPSSELSPSATSATAPRPRTAVLVLACLLVPISVLVGMQIRPDYEFVTIGFVGAAVMMTLMLMRAANAGRALEDMSRGREELLSRSLRATETERSRLAGEIHDGPIQRLAAASFYLENANRRLETGEADRALLLQRKASDILVGEIDSLRHLMTDLRPPALDEAGLVGALSDLVGSLHEMSSIDYAMDATDALPPLSADFETVIYRVTQEALRNVERHSQATSARIRLRKIGKGIELCVSDNGVGFEPGRAKEAFRDGHFGLAVMAHRTEMVGGALEIESGPGRGTLVRVSFGERSNSDFRA